MNITSYVLEDVRKFVNLNADNEVFDGELVPHIMAALGKLSQNGVAVPQIVGSTTTWIDVIEPEMIIIPEVFAMIPLFIMLSVKILFDPPPPSTVEYFQRNIDDTLWRLRLIYDTREVISNE